MVNGNSLVLCQPNTRTFEEIKALIKLRIINCNNIKIINHLMEILTSKELDADSIYAELKKNLKVLILKKNYLTLLNQLKVLINNFYLKSKLKQIL